MKITVVLGSGRENSRSRRVVEEILRGAAAAGHEAKIYDLSSLPLLGCCNCVRCRREDRDCVLPDALQSYWQDLRESGALIVSSPNYNSMPSGAMITFLNRHYCMLTADKTPRLDHDVKLLSVFSQGASESYTAYAEHYDWYIGCFKSKRILDAGRIVVGGDSDLSEGSEIMRRAWRLGAELA
ncbi:MAG: NAD(P)H-dependent oxidoreductase [Lachnospiraceae bacterium]|nr:NAD(P)H-dependent oxidoreductase [Lachnospiraceae bacterium]